MAKQKTRMAQTHLEKSLLVRFQLSSLYVGPIDYAVNPIPFKDKKRVQATLGLFSKKGNNMFPKFLKSSFFDCHYLTCYYIDSRSKNKIDADFTIKGDEYKRFCNDKKFPIKNIHKSLIYLDENCLYHREDGMAFIFHEDSPEEGVYYIHGVEYSKAEYDKKLSKKILFSAQKIKTLKKLLYIPEFYENVFYERKGDFISLIHKI